MLHDWRLSVYRDNVIGSLVDALGEAFPVVRQLIGADFFNAVAADFARDAPPTAPRLSRYGAGFPQRLSGLPQLVEVAYVADVASLEWARVEAYFCGAASTVLAVDRLLGQPAEILPQLRFKPISSLRMVRTATAAHSIWLAHQVATTDLSKLDPWRAESVRLLCTRSGVHCEPLEPAHAAFLSALVDGLDLTAAAEIAMDHDGSFDLQAALFAELAAGSFSEIELPGDMAASA